MFKDFLLVHLPGIPTNLYKIIKQTKLQVVEVGAEDCHEPDLTAVLSHAVNVGSPTQCDSSDTSQTEEHVSVFCSGLRQEKYCINFKNGTYFNI